MVLITASWLAAGFLLMGHSSTRSALPLSTAATKRAGCFSPVGMRRGMADTSAGATTGAAKTGR